MTRTVLQATLAAALLCGCGVSSGGYVLKISRQKPELELLYTESGFVGLPPLYWQVKGKKGYTVIPVLLSYHSSDLSLVLGGIANFGQKKIEKDMYGVKKLEITDSQVLGFINSSETVQRVDKTYYTSIKRIRFLWFVPAMTIKATYKRLEGSRVEVKKDRRLFGLIKI